VTCREFTAFLADYLAGELPGPQREAFHAHLAACPSCVAYMNTYQETIRLGRAALRPAGQDLPEDVPEELVQAILSARRRL
jgi:anti-sigma factor RsiW